MTTFDHTHAGRRVTYENRDESKHLGTIIVVHNVPRLVTIQRTDHRFVNVPWDMVELVPTETKPA